MGNYTRIFLNAKEECEIVQGFPWVFDNEILHVKYLDADGGAWKTAELVECAVADGSGIELFTKAGRFLGTGIINKKSKIIVRLISHEHADKVFENTKSFIEKKVCDAVNIRRVNYKDSESCRLIFAEADLLPGLIVERFVDVGGLTYLVVQFHALACEVFRKEIVNALVKACSVQGIYERSDAAIREKEGLAEKSGWIYGGGDETILINENGMLFYVDVAHGQKTGFFLDQKDNRKAAAAFCRGKRVLDAFAHTGAFALYAAAGGAKEVIAAEISEAAVAMIKKNSTVNKAGGVVKTVCMDVFTLLKEYEASGEKFDVIILDPPAFAKSAKSIQKAYGGYKEINVRAMRLLRDGGILVTCSCSTFFDAPTFYDMLMHAARDSHRRVQILAKRGASFDHPVLLGYERSEYLKCAIARVL
ncbi:MAG: class I SAM-dependent rRNA methyltransferase [Treponema sp.]|nr:class I SAM-dependent rRNA methyltransferase [Treponema sp.]